MKDDLKKDLILNDKKRINIRKKYKENLINEKKSLSKKDYLFFPKSLISEENYQLRYGLSWIENGFIIKVGKNIIAVDPGVNFVFRLTESGFDLSTITHIYISHLHLDHSADANVLMDFLIRCRKKVEIIAPKSVFDEKVISDFHSGIKIKFPVNHKPIIVNEDSEVELLDGYKMKFVSLYHSVECLGFKIFNNKVSYTYLSDTSYTKELITNKNEKINITEIKDYNENVISYSAHNSIRNFALKSNVLIANVDSFMYTKNSKTHLPLLDLVEILKDSNIKKVVLAHVNPMGELKYEEWSEKLARYITKNIKIKTLAIKFEKNKIYL